MAEGGKNGQDGCGNVYVYGYQIGNREYIYIGGKKYMLTVGTMGIGNSASGCTT